jgi:hypothetical protein
MPIVVRPLVSPTLRVVLLALCTLTSGMILPATISAQTSQPSYDVLRVEQDGTVMPYNIWIDWMPLLVTTPDKGAWALFSAQAKLPDATGTQRLYAARFDPDGGVWLPAQALPGGEIQFGPSAVVDSKGTVHLVYSDRKNGDAGVYSTLVYTHSDGQGGWAAPAPVAADPNAGHQMMPSLVIDSRDGLHVVWRDQRVVDAAARQTTSANADVFSSDLVDGQWNAPTQVDQRASADANAAWPIMAIDGERLVAIWSIYQGSPEEQKRARRVEWSTRPLNNPKGWSKPTLFVDAGPAETGGRLVDLASNPKGGAIAIIGRIADGKNTMMMRRLDAGAGDWGKEFSVGSGDLGYQPSLSVNADGTAAVVYTHGRNQQVEVGAQVVPAGAEQATPEVILTADEEGLQARASVAVGPDGRVWVAYMHQPSDAPANEVRCLRGAKLAA